MDRELLLEIGTEEIPASWLPGLTTQLGQVLEAKLKEARLSADELDGVAIAERVDHAQVSAGDADQVERRTVREGVRRDEAHAAIARYGRRRFRDEVGRGLGNAREHL